jgi:hypothetical protein
VKAISLARNQRKPRWILCCLALLCLLANAVFALPAPIQIATTKHHCCPAQKAQHAAKNECSVMQKNCGHDNQTCANQCAQKLSSTSVLNVVILDWVALPVPACKEFSVRNILLQAARPDPALRPPIAA